MSDRQRTVNSHCNTFDETENGDDNHRTQKNIESSQDRRSVEPNTNQTEDTQPNPLLISKCFLSQITTKKIKIHL